MSDYLEGKPYTSTSNPTNKKIYVKEIPLEKISRYAKSKINKKKREEDKMFNCFCGEKFRHYPEIKKHRIEKDHKRETYFIIGGQQDE